MIYYIEQDREKRNTAGSKAPDDVCEICRRSGYTRIGIQAFPKEAGKLYQKLWLLRTGNAQWRELGNTVEEGDVVLFQHPSYGKRIALNWIPRIQKKKGCHFVALIHDLESLRGGIAGVIKENKKTNQIGDHALLQCFDAVICHNEHMRQYMIGQGFDPEKVLNLEIFDYLSDCARVQPKKGSAPSVAIAGNLALGKCGYIYKIFENGVNPGLTVNLYGINFEESAASDRFVWHGSFKPEELPDHLIGDFGLVWDGPTAETCGGNTGEYLRYNNPHKTSLYLASGMPVVVWSEAAIADFVRENGVGITVSSLAELESAIRAVTPEDYERICANVRRVGAQLREGYYTNQALQKAVQII